MEKTTKFAAYFTDKQREEMERCRKLEGSRSTAEYLRNAVEFGDLAAKDILTHRMDLEAVSLDASAAEIAAAFTESRFSRLLVYEESIDRIVGVIHHKDFYNGLGVTDRPLAEIMSTPVLVQPGDKVVVGNYVGSDIKLDGVDYKFVKQDDILAVVID